MTPSLIECDVIKSSVLTPLNPVHLMRLGYTYTATGPVNLRLMQHQRHWTEQGTSQACQFHKCHAATGTAGWCSKQGQGRITSWHRLRSWAVRMQKVPLIGGSTAGTGAATLGPTFCRLNTRANEPVPHKGALCACSKH